MPEITDEMVDRALVSAMNAHRRSQGYYPLADIDAVRKEYKDDMQKRWLDTERRKVEAALKAVLPFYLLRGALA